MGTGRCIFILGATRFGAHVESTSYSLAKEFAKSNIVYYIEYPFTFVDRFKKSNRHEFELRRAAIAGANAGIMPSGIPNLNIVTTPPLLSIHFLPEGKLYRKLLSYNERLLAKRVKQIIEKRSLQNFVYINSFVFHYPNLSDYIKASVRVYHCVDPIITSYDVKHGMISEQILMNKSDLVLCTSQQLYREKSKLHKSAYFLPNAADIYHSSKATDPEIPIHEKLRNIPKPIVGYFGNIERRTDFELIRQVAKRNTDLNFVFAGPVETHLVPSFFYDIPNVHLTGRIKYDEMPNMLKGFDVAVIPFKKTEESNTVFPLKLFEYLGAGKPVVATDFNPDLERITGELVSYCSNADEFSYSIRKALNEDSTKLQTKRIELARQHTWEKRAQEINMLIESKQTKKDAVVNLC
jgi:teichuronic acid biosynthesis glycosyltransferase TuaH